MYENYDFFSGVIIAYKLKIHKKKKKEKNKG